MKSIKEGDIIGDRLIVKIIKQFSVLYKGWELDNEAYLVKHERVTKKHMNEKAEVGYVFSSHGAFFVDSGDDFIEEKIREYEQVLVATKAAYQTKLFYSSGT